MAVEEIIEEILISIARQPQLAVTTEMQAAMMQLSGFQGYIIMRPRWNAVGSGTVQSAKQNIIQHASMTTLHRLQTRAQCYDLKLSARHSVGSWTFKRNPYPLNSELVRQMKTLHSLLVHAVATNTAGQ